MYPRCAQLFLTILFLTTCFSVTAKSADVVKASNSKASEIVFVDAGIKNSEALLRGVNPQVDVVYIDSQRDGVEQIAQTLATRKNINAIHILSHGRSGMLDLGATKLTAASILGKHADEMNIIRGALSQNADILVYGCNFAQGARGAKAVELLAATIGADVLASDNLTGAAALGGDWDMEIRSGEIETAQISAEGWNDVLAPILINATSAPALSGGTGVGAKALWSNAGAVGATAIDLQAEVISGTGTNIVFSNSSTGTGNVKVRTLSTVETTIRWQAFETGTMNPVSGEPTFMMLDIDGAGGVPESVESVAASLTGLLSYTVDTATELVVTTVSGTVRASGTFDAPNAQSTTYEAAWVSYDWTGVSSWDMVYKSEVASAHDYVHDGNGEFIFTSPNVTLADSTPPVVAITSSLIANAANASTYSVSGGCTAGDGDVTVLITNATPASQPATCTGGGAWSASFDVTAITDANNAIIIDANQTDAATNTGNATQVLLDKDVAIATPTINALTTNNTTPTITGTAEAASAVAVTVAGATFTVAANGSGDWSVDTSVVPDLGTFSPDVNGSNEVSATSTDAAGNTALDVTANELIIDTTAPSIPTVNTLVTNDTTPVITGTWDDATAASLSVTVNSVTYVLGTDAQLSNVAANWTLDLSAVTLVAGAYGVVVSTADAAGNTSGDATANELIIIGVANPVNTTINVNLASVAADGSLSTITVQAKDINGIDLNASGGTVTLAATGSASISAVMDNNDGTYTATISNLVVEPVTISGTINGGGNAITDTAAVSFTIGAASGATTTITATPTSVLIGGASSTITVQAKDSNGNNFAGSAGTVVLSTTSGAVINSVIDNNNGTYTATVSNTVVEVATITGTIAGNAITDNAAVTFTPDGNFTIDAINNVNLNENAAYTGVTPAITGTPIGAVAYSLSGADAGDFAINTSTGVVSMVARDFEFPADANTDNVYALTITATDTDANVATRSWTVAVNDVFEDADSDGLSDAIECPLGPPNCPDTDGDGIPDFQETDSDGDGISDAVEVGSDPNNPTDSDGDSIPDYVDNGDDFDGDGILDVIECPDYLSDCPDSDNDGQLDYVEIDSDSDNILDKVEAGVDPTQPVNTDGDLVSDAPDYQDADSDEDGVPDSVEGVVDTDGDSIPDYIDVASAGPDAGDSDGDGILDDIECELYRFCADSDADGTRDYMETDSDNDGIDDAIEVNTSGNDLDTDGIDDNFDIDSFTSGVDALDLNSDGIIDTHPLDSDGDGTPDYQDTDSDNDGISDNDVSEGLTDIDADGIPDYVDVDINNSAGTADNSGDSDSDGISDFVECPAYPTCPDSDGDGKPDYFDAKDQDGPLGNIDGDSELNYLDLNDDNDGIADSVEDLNTDGDDNPFTNPTDTDGDGTPDYQDADSDNDGIDDVIEGVIDSDGDGIPDYVDAAGAGSDAGDSDGDGASDLIECPSYPACPDSDSDGIPDYMDADSTPAVSAAETTISVSAASVAADGASSTITVQAKDANGNNLTISGGAVTLAATGSGIIAAVTDNGDGTYTATISNQVAEAVTISGTISGNAITDTAIVTFTAADVAVAPTSSGGGGGSSNNPAYMLLLLLILVTLRFKRRT